MSKDTKLAFWTFGLAIGLIFGAIIDRYTATGAAVRSELDLKHECCCRHR